MKPIREWRWSDEGYQYRKKDVLIIKPKKSNKKYQVRISYSKKGKPLDVGECDCITRKMAFQEGNKLVRIIRKLTVIAKKPK